MLGDERPGAAVEIVLHRRALRFEASTTMCVVIAARFRARFGVAEQMFGAERQVKNLRRGN